MRIEGRKAFRRIHWSREGFKARGGLGRRRLEKASVDLETIALERTCEVLKFPDTWELHPSCDTIMEVRMCRFRMSRALTSTSGDCPRSLLCSLEGLWHHHKILLWEATSLSCYFLVVHSRIALIMLKPNWSLPLNGERSREQAGKILAEARSLVAHGLFFTLPLLSTVFVTWSY